MANDPLGATFRTITGTFLNAKIIAKKILNLRLQVVDLMSILSAVVSIDQMIVAERLVSQHFNALTTAGLVLGCFGHGVQLADLELVHGQWHDNAAIIKKKLE
jgi:phosphosulfolactate phosphohydrolase-like enzyme